MDTNAKRAWFAYTSGNAAPDREEFEEWAFSQPGALSASDPDVYAWLLRLALAIEDAERAMDGQAVDDRTARAILRETTEKFGLEQNGTSRQHAEMLERFGRAEARHGHTRHARIFDDASREMLRKNGADDGSVVEVAGKWYVATYDPRKAQWSGPLNYPSGGLRHWVCKLRADIPRMGARAYPSRSSALRAAEDE